MLPEENIGDFCKRRACAFLCEIGGRILSRSYRALNFSRTVSRFIDGQHAVSTDRDEPLRTVRAVAFGSIPQDECFCAARINAGAKPLEMPVPQKERSLARVCLIERAFGEPALRLGHKSPRRKSPLVASDQ
jgi:hypothetical protein